MLKPKGVEPVDWEKIYLNEDEFLEVESSIGSQEESEGDPGEQVDVSEPLELKQPVKA